MSPLSLISILILALLAVVFLVSTYLVISRSKLAYPLHDARDNCVMYLHLKADLTVSTGVAALFLPRCSTPYSTAVSINSMTFELISPKDLKTI
jgi:hypothetical protein